MDLFLYKLHATITTGCSPTCQYQNENMDFDLKWRDMVVYNIQNLLEHELPT